MGADNTDHSMMQNSKTKCLLEIIAASGPVMWGLLSQFTSTQHPKLILIKRHKAFEQTRIRSLCLCQSISCSGHYNPISFVAGKTVVQCLSYLFGNQNYQIDTKSESLSSFLQLYKKKACVKTHQTINIYLTATSPSSLLLLRHKFPMKHIIPPSVFYHRKFQKQQKLLLTAMHPANLNLKTP